MIVPRLFKGKPPEIPMIHGHIILCSPISTISTCRRMGNLHLGFEKSPVTAAVCCKAFMCFSTAKMGASLALHGVFILQAFCERPEVGAAVRNEIDSIPLGNGACGGLWHRLVVFPQFKYGRALQTLPFLRAFKDLSCSKAKLQHFWHVRAGEL